MADATLTLNADTRDLDKATESLKKVEKQSEKTEKATKNLGKSYATMAKVAAAATVAIAAVFTRQIIKNTGQQQAAVAQLNASLQSTGRFTPQASKALLDYAEALRVATGVGDELIIDAEAMLATFNKIGGDVFPRAIESALDLSAKFGNNLKSSIVQVGKALQDPILGLRALRRVGVSFGDDQKKLIKTLVETGETLKAQEIILDALETNVGGAARAYRETLPGALDAAKTAFGELLEGDGDGLRAANEGMNELIEILEDPATKEGFRDLATGALEFLGVMAQIPGAISFAKAEFEAFFGTIDNADVVRLDDKLADLNETLERMTAPGLVGVIGRFVNPATEQQIAAINEEIRTTQNLLDEIESQRGEGEPIDPVGDAGAGVAETLTSEIAAADAAAKALLAQEAATAALNAEKKETLRLIRVTTEEREGTGASDILRDLAFETELIGKSNQEREELIALRSLENEHLLRTLELKGAGVAQNEEEAQQIRDAIALKSELIFQDEQIQGLIEAEIELRKQQTEATNAFYRQLGNNASDAFGDFITGSKTAKDAFKDFSDQIIRDLIRIAIQKAITAAIGGGQSGFGDFFAGVFGPGRAVGGRIYPGTAHPIGERGPELLTTGGKSVVVGGPTGGSVTPITNNNNSRSVSNIFNLPPETPRENPEQIAYSLNRFQTKAHARTR